MRTRQRAGTKFGCLNWAVNGGLGGIILSWIISPVLAGIIGIIIFGTTRSIIFNNLYPEKAAVIALPFLLSLTIYLVTFSVAFKKQAKLGGVTGVVLIPLVLTAISAAVGIYLMRRIKKKLAKMSLMEIRQMSVRNTMCPTLCRLRIRRPGLLFSSSSLYIYMKGKLRGCGASAARAIYGELDNRMRSRYFPRKIS